jgi:EAL domain-containing protein (putative c-di-GMP-specific phosphodiesterase class I)
MQSGHEPIAINVSAIQLQRSNLPELIVDRTRALGLEPTLLQVELTEGTIFERREGRNGELNEDAVAHLHDLGVTLPLMTLAPDIRACPT